MLIIYVPAITNRLLYVMDYVFKEQLGVEYALYNNKEEFILHTSTQRIIYAEEMFDNDALFFFSTGLLVENDIKDIEVKTGTLNSIPVLFQHKNEAALGFDVFAAVFYLLSRYEEYLKKPTDKFGNFAYQNSILYQLHILHTPVVEVWINMLKQVLAKQLPFIQFKQTKASFALSFDIDVAYAYQNKSFKRIAGGIIKKIIKLQLAELLDQLLTLLRVRKDIYDTFDYILQHINNNKSLFFFNMGSYNTYDKNPSYKNKTFRRLIQRIHSKHITGLHPSYASNSNKNLIAQEKQWLEEIVNYKVVFNRQHYLKLKFPNTYRHLIENGMRTAFTIGYHDAYGFRAGTCKPFFFFNLETNETTNLYLYPFSIMEGTLNDVMHLSISEAKKIITDLLNVVTENYGVFIPLWHDSTLSNSEHWKGWREVFEHMLDEKNKRKLINKVNNL